MSAPGPGGGGSTSVPPDIDDGYTGAGDAGTVFPSFDGGVGLFDASVGLSDSGAASNPDAGDADAGDADVAEGGCLDTSDQRDAGGCYGELCSTSLAQLRSSTTGGACNEPSALALACDGQISRTAAECAQASTTSVWFDNAVRTCLRSSPALDDVPGACLDCYSAELLCTLSQCLVACVSGLQEECRSCRNQHCAANFEVCSGIATP